MKFLRVPVVAMILAGGRVDELSVLTFFRPKAAVPFGGLYRVIDFPLTNLMRSGIWLTGVLSQYRSYSLINHLENGASWDMVGRRRGLFILPPFQGREASDWYKGTADAVYQNLEFIRRWRPKEVLILSGDHVYNMDYRTLLEFHRSQKADLTVAFIPVSQDTAHRFGQGVLAEDNPFGGRLLDYKEKAKPPVSNLASLTIYVFRTEVLEEVLETNARESSHEFGRDIIPKMLGLWRVYGFVHRGYWGYTRTIEEYWSTHMHLLGPNPKLDLRRWKVCTNLNHRYIRDRGPTIIGQKARICDSLFYNGSRIEGEIVRSVIFPGVHIGPGAVVKDSILLFDTKVESEARLERVISDTEVNIGARATLIGEKEPILIGRQAQIPAEIHIASGVTIYPAVGEKVFKSSKIRAGEIVR